MDQSPVLQVRAAVLRTSDLTLSWKRDRKRVEMLRRGFRKGFSPGGCKLLRSVSNLSAVTERRRRHRAAAAARFLTMGSVLPSLRLDGFLSSSSSALRLPAELL